MTVQNIKNIKFQPEDFTERYVLKTPKFYLGIEALIDSSPTMKEVFKEAPIPKLQKEKVENDAEYETWALWQLLNTIKITPPVNPALLTYAQRVAYVAPKTQWIILMQKEFRLAGGRKAPSLTLAGYSGFYFLTKNSRSVSPLNLLANAWKSTVLSESL